jgi:hypothetical protein
MRRVESLPPGPAASVAITSASRLLLALAQNAVPAGGWFVAGWAPGTTLAVYWFENLVSSLTLGARMSVHRRATRTRGHRDQTVGSFLMVALGFTLVHGVFVGLMLLLVKIGPVDWDAVVGGARAVLCVHAASLVFDLLTIARWPFAEIRRRTDAALSRIIVLHMGLLVGMGGAIALDAPTSFFSVFIALKAMTELSSVLPQWNPDEPPRALVALMSLFPLKPGEESFTDYWRRTTREECERHTEDEQRM